MKESIIKIIRKLALKFGNKTFLYASIFAFCLVMFIVLLSLFSRADNGIKETRNELISLSRNIHEHYKMRPDFWGLDNSEAIRNNLLPQTISINENILKGFWGKEIIIGSDEHGHMVMPTQKNFAITYKNLSKEECVVLASEKFNENFWFSVTRVSVSSGAQNQIFEWGSGEFGLPLAKKQAKKICKIIFLQFAIYPV